ncbi:MAG: winged helix-turn-helix transcriptional regulator [Ignavibacteria bacterium]|nr:winged helix-turn-helix transcriptional regulator [Ignavibacteria bacterium]
MNKESESVKLDMLFSSLGDSTRREILSRIKEKPQNIIKLAEDFNMSLPAVSKHIKILSEAQFIIKEKKGRFIYCSYNFNAIKPALDWINTQHSLWDNSFNKLTELIKIKTITKRGRRNKR